MVLNELYLLNPEHYFKELTKLIMENASENSLIIICTNKPSSHMINSFKEKNIPLEKIYFIDCISREVGLAEKRTKNVMYVDSPKNITEMALKITELTKKIKGKKALVMDSLSTLMIYNNHDVVAKFSNFIVNNLRESGTKTIILTLHADSKTEVIERVKSFVDEVKHIE